MTAGRTVEEGADGLVERFLASWSGRTRQAYTVDVQDFARFRGKAAAEAVADLLASRQQGHRLVLDFAAELRRRGRAWSTVRRRLGTLSSLVGMAGDLGMVAWSLEVPANDEISATAEASKGK